jgi:hypothetical protein
VIATGGLRASLPGVPDQGSKKFRPRMHADTRRCTVPSQSPWAIRRISRRDRPKLSNRQRWSPVVFKSVEALGGVSMIQCLDRLQFDNDRPLDQQIDRVRPDDDPIVFDSDSLLLYYGQSGPRLRRGRPLRNSWANALSWFFSRNPDLSVFITLNAQAMTHSDSRLTRVSSACIHG